MGARHGLAAILRDAPQRCGAPQDEVVITHVHWEGERMGRISSDLVRGWLRVTVPSVLAFGAALSVASAQAPASGRPIAAVLPLENDSGDAAQDFFAEGMTDEIAVALTGVAGIGVVARS